MSSDLSSRVLLLAVLELIVGGIVVLGGAALIYFSVDTTGKALGIIHSTLGLTGLVAGSLLWARKNGSWTLTVWANVLIIAFSTASEVALFGTGSLPSDQFVDSIIGTVVAIVIAVVVTILIMRPDLKMFVRKGRGLDDKRREGII
jgi:4-amino-4-deoxy-L-arabinose transferase-like glycosyltransferase